MNFSLICFSNKYLWHNTTDLRRLSRYPGARHLHRHTEIHHEELFVASESALRVCDRRISGKINTQPCTL